jgi:hypothetical protein
VRGITLVLTEPAWTELVAALGTIEESAGVLSVRFVEGPGDLLTVLGRNMAWAPEDAYTVRRADELVLESLGWVPGLSRAAAAGDQAFFLHTHPGAHPDPSDKDGVVDEAIAATFRARTGQDIYGHLVLGGTPERPMVRGVVTDSNGDRRPVAGVRVVGDRLRVIVASDQDDVGVPLRFDRQVRAFGDDGQRVLGQFHVGVVGGGGTGSSVFEQLVRLGIGTITMIDPKDLTEGNVTRVYGSSVADVGRPKVEIAWDNAAAIGLGTEVNAVVGSITDLDVARTLRHCDVVFGCTDDNAGRMVLSRLGYFFLLPVIDLGVVIDTIDDTVRGVYGRITVTGPGAACLLCRTRVDTERARTEALDEAERARLVGEGYAAGLGDPDPSVVSFTTVVAASGVSELLERLFAFGPTPPPTEQILRMHLRRVNTNRCVPREGCYCSRRELLGAGDVEPWLEMTW